MICPNCKKDIPDSSILCPECSYNVTDYDKQETFIESLKNTMQKKKEVGDRVLAPVGGSKFITSKLVLFGIFNLIQFIFVVPILCLIGIYLISSSKATEYKLVDYESRNGGYIGVYVSKEDSNTHLKVEEVYKTKEEVPKDYTFNMKKEINPGIIVGVLLVLVLVEVFIIKKIIKAYINYKRRQDTFV